MQVLKRFLYNVKDYTDRINAAQANTMIQDACEDVYRGDLDVTQKRHIRQCKDLLIDNVKNLGERGALELLAALGDYMNHNGNGGGG
jgi:hypothetical protein